MGLNFKGRSRNYTFVRHSSCAELQHAPGIYAILYWNERYCVLEMGQARDVRSHLEMHNRNAHLEAHLRTGICLAVLYAPGLNDVERMRIEQELREIHKPQPSAH
jgi:hypothetical protein